MGHVYQHTTFQRFVSVSKKALNMTSVATTVSAATENACLNICHKQSSCLSAVFDEISSQCSMYDTQINGEGVAAKQDYFLVVKKTIHEDVIGNHSLYSCIKVLHSCFSKEAQTDILSRIV